EALHVAVETARRWRRGIRLDGRSHAHGRNRIRSRGRRRLGFPRRAVVAAEVADRHRHHQQLGAETGRAAAGDRSPRGDRRRVTKPRILVVEDNEKTAELLRVYLESGGFAVSVAGDAATARASFRQFGPALVLLDVLLPGGDGFTLC